MRIINFMVGRLMLLIALLLIIMLFCGGCWGSMNEEFVRAVDTNWKVMGKDYRGYVANDAELPDSSKEIRLKAIDEFSQLVEDAKKELK